MSSTTPDSLAFGMILRVLVLRIARIEHGAAYLDGLDEIRASVIEGIGRIHIADAAVADSLTLRAQAQAVAELLLARKDSGTGAVADDATPPDRIGPASATKQVANKT